MAGVQRSAQKTVENQISCVQKLATLQATEPQNSNNFGKGTNTLPV
jgi:hypothetical protein